MQKKNLPKTALITGGANGIGKAIARKLAREKMQVAIADLETPMLEEKDIVFKKTNVAKASDIDSLFEWMSETIGSPEVLVINAGQGINESLIEGDPEKWQKVIETNLMGALRCIRAFVPQMMKRKKGNVVLISSVSANQPHPYGGVYSATKTALEVIAETLRLESIPYVNVTVISPGITDTDFFKNQISGNTSVEELGMGAISPEEIAEDIFYAISKKPGTSINKIITRPIEQSF